MKGVDGSVESIPWIRDTCKGVAILKFPYVLSGRIVQIVVRIRTDTHDYVRVWQMKKEMPGIFICNMKLT